MEERRVSPGRPVHDVENSKLRRTVDERHLRNRRGDLGRESRERNTDLFPEWRRRRDEEEEEGKRPRWVPRMDEGNYTYCLTD